MACGDQVRSTHVNRGWTKSIKVTSPIRLEDLVEKKVQSSLQDGAIHELAVLADMENEYSAGIKQKIHIFDHPKNLIGFFWSRLTIAQG